MESNQSYETEIHRLGECLRISSLKNHTTWAVRWMFGNKFNAQRHSVRVYPTLRRRTSRSLLRVRGHHLYECVHGRRPNEVTWKDLVRDELRWNSIFSGVDGWPTFHSGFTWRMMESVKAQVDPFPFVPVTWMTLSEFKSSVYALLLNVSRAWQITDVHYNLFSSDTRSFPE